MAKTPKRPRDMMQLAKFIGEIATGEASDVASEPTPAQQRAAKGGRARAEKLPAPRRLAIAKQGGEASAARRKRP